MAAKVQKFFNKVWNSRIILYLCQQIEHANKLSNLANNDE